MNGGPPVHGAVYVPQKQDVEVQTQPSLPNSPRGDAFPKFTQILDDVMKYIRVTHPKVDKKILEAETEDE